MIHDVKCKDRIKYSMLRKTLQLKVCSLCVIVMYLRNNDNDHKKKLKLMMQHSNTSLSAQVMFCFFNSAENYMWI